MGIERRMRGRLLAVHVAWLAACASGETDGVGGAVATGSAASSTVDAGATTASVFNGHAASSGLQSSSSMAPNTCTVDVTQNIDWRVVLTDGTVLDENQLDAQVGLALPLAGEIVSLDPQGFVIDTCAPSDGCAPALVTFDFTTRDGAGNVVGPDALALTAGAFVSITGHTDVLANINENPANPTDLRALHLEVHNLETFGGVQNPIESGDALLLVVSANGWPHAALPPEIALTREIVCLPTAPPSLDVNTKLTFTIGGVATDVFDAERRSLEGGPPNLEAWNVASRLTAESGFFPPQFFLWRNDAP